MSTRLTVIDVFCGAGGFSEGFRQQGYKILLGVDSWEPAIKTYNHNFVLNCKTKNVLDFENSIEEIEALPDSDIIIGSPPCVTFSSSNISGKADKTSGIKLTQIFLRIVAIKKWQPESKLKGWFMENVLSSIKHLGAEYTFEELGLGERGLAKLEKRIQSGKLTKSSINNRGYNKYLKLDGQIQVSIDRDKFNQDSKWDGLKGYETNSKLPKEEILANYNHLWRIEKAFRVAKHDLKIRPIFHAIKYE